MPQRKRIFVKALLPLGLLAMVAAILRRSPDDWEYERIDEEIERQAVEAPAQRRCPAHACPPRLAIAAAFSTLFFAGAAFTAGAGDQLVRLADEDVAALEAAADLTAPPETETRRTAPERGARGGSGRAGGRAGRGRTCRAAGRGRSRGRGRARGREPAPRRPERAARRADAEPAPSTAAAEAAEPVAEAAPAAEAAPSNVVSAAPARRGRRRTQTASPKPAPAAKRAARRRNGSSSGQPPPRRRRRRSSIEHGGEPTIWLNRSLPDPTPASARLTRPFAKHLLALVEAPRRRLGAVLGVLRAQGERGSVPASPSELDTLGRPDGGHRRLEGRAGALGTHRLRRPRRRVRRPVPLRRVESLVTGYAAAKDRPRREGAVDAGHPDLRGRPHGHHDGPDRCPGPRPDRLPRRAARLGDGVEPLLGPPHVRAARRRLGARLRPCGRRRRRRRHRRSPGTSSRAASPRRRFGRCSSSRASSSRSR